jgi:hypothetical protein
MYKWIIAEQSDAEQEQVLICTTFRVLLSRIKNKSKFLKESFQSNSTNQRLRCGIVGIG